MLRAAVLGAGAAAFAYLVYNYWKKSKAPPQEGWIPFIGCAIEFGKAPLTFIKSRGIDKHGAIFTIYVAGKRMTFINDVNYYGVFFNGEPDVSFQAAVQPFTFRAAGITPPSFEANHMSAHDALKGRLGPTTIGSLVSTIASELLVEIDRTEIVEVDNVELMRWIRRLIFKSSVVAIFGPKLTVNHNISEIEHHFANYDHDFEYGAELPELFVRQWAQSKRYLLNVFRNFVQLERAVSGTNQTRNNLDSVLCNINENDRVPYLLLSLWASQANSTPIIFWIIVYLINNPLCMQIVLDEIQSLLGQFGSSRAREKLNEITMEQLNNNLTYTKKCVLETIRLRSPGLLPRKVTKDIKLGEFIIPKGHMLVLSPYWAHLNPILFPEPELFNPNRWNSNAINQGKFLEGFVAFGGGRFQCPGRWFAIAELQVFVVTLLSTLNFQPASTGVPDPCPLHLVGVPEPNTPYHCRVSRITSPTPSVVVV